MMINEIIQHNDNAYRVKYKFPYSTFTNKTGEFINEILVEYKKQLNIEHVLKKEDNYLYFCELIPDAEIINDNPLLPITKPNENE